MSWEDLGLEHIQSVNYQVAGMEQTLLGFGTILIHLGCEMHLGVLNEEG